VKSATVSTVLIPAGSKTILQEAGDRFTIISTSGPVKIKPEPAGDGVIYYGGASPKFSAPFQFLTIVNQSSTATLTMLIWVGFENLPNQFPLQIPVTPIEILGSIKTTGTAQALSTTDLYFRLGFVYGYSGFAGTPTVPTNNQNNAYVGRSQKYQPDLLAPGLAVPFSVPDGELLNAANCYINGVANDGWFFTCI
jgi:hypothetical protein